MKCKLKKNQRVSNASETPCINSQSGMAVTVYTRDARRTLPRATIPPFVFIKSYYWPCKNFNARGDNLLKPTSIRRHYTQNNFFAARSTFATNNVLVGKLFCRYGGACVSMIPQITVITET